MVAGRIVRLTAAAVGVALGGIVFAQTAEIEAELQLRLAQLRLKQAELAQKKAAPAAKPLPAAEGPHAGVVARLGDSRLRHAAPPRCVVFSPDGKRLYSGGEDGLLKVWDSATGEPVAAQRFPETSPVALRFTHGGTRLTVSLADGRVRVLNPETLAEVAAIGFAPGGEFDLSRDGTLLAAYSGSGSLTVTDLATELPRVELPPGSPFAFHPAGKTIAVADKSGKVALHMIAGGKPIVSLDHGAPVRGLAFSPDGKRLATGGADGTGTETVKVWDVSDPKHPKVAAEVAGASRPREWLGPDRLAAGGSTATGVYDLSEKKWIGSAKGVGGEWAVSPDGKRVAATGNGGLRVRVWDLGTGVQLHAENDTFPDAALLAPSADGKSVFVLAGDAAFHWPVAKSSATAAGTLPSKAVLGVAAGGRLAVATADAVLVYDGFDPTRPLPAKPGRTLGEHAAGVRSLAVSADGRRVAYSGTDAKTVIADAATGKPVRTLPIQTVGLALAFSPDAKHLAVIGRDGFLRLWASEGDGPDVWKVRIQRGQKGTIAFSPDGKRIAASSSGVLKVVDSANGSEQFSLGGLFENGLFQQAAFSPDGRLLVTASEGSSGGVQVWELATHTLVRRFSTGFGTAYRLGLFADGTRAVSAGAEEVITVWDLTGRHGRGDPTADELLLAWGDLESLEGAKGYPATRILAAGGKRGLDVMTAGITETVETRKKVARWVKELGSEEFADREAATKELTALGYRALAAVQAAAGENDSAEAKKRAGDILNRFTAKGTTSPPHGLCGDDLRLLRAVQVLEDVGGPVARALLRKIVTLGGPAGEAARVALKLAK